MQTVKLEINAKQKFCEMKDEEIAQLVDIALATENGSSPIIFEYSRLINNLIEQFKATTEPEMRGEFLRISITTKNHIEGLAARAFLEMLKQAHRNIGIEIPDELFECI